MNKQAMKEKLCAAIDARRDDIIAIGTKIFENPS